MDLGLESVKPQCTHGVEEDKEWETKPHIETLQGEIGPYND